MFAYKAFFAATFALTIVSCGEGDNTTSNTNSVISNSLQDYWVGTQCSIDNQEPTRSNRTDLSFTNNEVAEWTYIFFNSVDCTSPQVLAATLKGTYNVSGNTTTVTSGEAHHLDMQFNTGGFSATQELIDQLALQGITLQDLLAAQGITGTENLPASLLTNATNRYTIFQQQEDMLSIATNTSATSNTENTRLSELNTTFQRSNNNTTSTTPEPTNNNGNLSELEALNASIPQANRPISAVALTVEMFTVSPPYVTFEGRMMMTFPNGYSTYCMDWNILNESPTPNSIGDRCDLTREPQNDTPLRPFQPGTRINIAFGSLEASGYEIPGTISTSSIREGDLLLNEAGEIVLSSRNLSSTTGTAAMVTTNSNQELQGHYYLNGYTITMKFLDGAVYHDFIGVLGTDAGRVTSLFLGNRYYSENL